jgi:hypothetical protein
MMFSEISFWDSFGKRRGRQRNVKPEILFLANHVARESGLGSIFLGKIK